MRTTNKILSEAKNEKNGEFFLLKEEIEKEMIHYAKFLAGKRIYIPNTKLTVELAQNDAFARYFCTSSMIKKLNVAEVKYSYYDENGNFVLITMTKNGITKNVISASDDENRLFYVYKEIDKSDVIISNPEGNKVKDVFTYVYLSKKDYIFCVSKNFMATRIAATAHAKGKMNFGHNIPKKFYDVKNDKVVRPTSMWITSISNGYTPKVITTFYDTNSYDYQKFDNYDAINVECIKMIPMDYKGCIGLPITFFPFLNKEQFEIIGVFNRFNESDDKNGCICGELAEYIDNHGKIEHTTGPVVNGKAVYTRLLIRFRNI